jgi:O-antigen ligase
MITNDQGSRSFRLKVWVGVAGVGVGIVVGLLAGIQSLLPGLVMVAVTALVCFFTSFERTVIGLLILRSSLDLFSAQQLPAAFALGVDALALLYVAVRLLTRQPVYTDGFFWFLVGWLMLEGVWVVLLPLGALGQDASFLPGTIREWLRYFSWVMVYLLIMQLRDRIHPEKIISMLLLSLIAPITVALIQIFLPASVLPALLTAQGKVGSNVSGTLGFPNGLGIFLTLFIGLVWWKMSSSQPRWSWLLLLILVGFVFVNTGYFTGLLAVILLLLFINASKLTPVRIIGAVIACIVFVALFGSTEFGQQRLTEISQTPLLNPDIDASRAIILSYGDSNSFNWRIAHWTLLLESWKQAPLLGHGLATSPYLGIRNLESGGGYAAHNDYVKALVEQGILGLAIFLGFLGAQAIHLVRLLVLAPKNSSQRNLCLILLALFLCNVVSMLSNNILDATTLFFYWWTLLAIAGWGTERWRTHQSIREPEIVQRE